jgi:hypothetical protein
LFGVPSQHHNDFFILRTRIPVAAETLDIQSERNAVTEEYLRLAACMIGCRQKPSIAVFLQ